MPIPDLTLSIVAQDEEQNIARCIRSVGDLVSEIIVIDGGSQDGTVKVASELGANVIHNPWPGYRDQKNFALSNCTGSWILALDCDEELSPELRESIVQFFKNGDHQKFNGAFCNRKVWFLGRWITHGDWYPDRKLRLFRLDSARWEGSHEHDKIRLEGDSTRLQGDLHHFSFPHSSSFIRKINVFADAYLVREKERGKSWTLFGNITRPIWRFIRSYFLRLGFLDGFPGLWIATAIAFQTFVRHSRTYEDAVDKNPPEINSPPNK